MTDPKDRESSPGPTEFNDDSWSTPPEVSEKPVTRPKPWQVPPGKPPSRRDHAGTAPTDGAVPNRALPAAAPTAAPRVPTAPVASPAGPAPVPKAAVVQPPLVGQVAEKPASKNIDWLDALLARDPTTARVPRADADARGLGSSEHELFGVSSQSTYDERYGEAAEPDIRAGVERCKVGLCTFWIGPRCFALDIGLIGEVVNVERVVEVPLTPPAFVGLFNLRGTPVALVDLAKVLELGDTPQPRTGGESRTLLALVLRFSGVTVGALIDRMQAVVAPDKAGLIRVEDGDHPLVQGFLAESSSACYTVTVLESNALMARFNSMKFVARSADA